MKETDKERESWAKKRKAKHENSLIVKWQHLMQFEKKRAL